MGKCCRSGSAAKEARSEATASTAIASERSCEPPSVQSVMATDIPQKLLLAAEGLPAFSALTYPSLRLYLLYSAVLRFTSPTFPTSSFFLCVFSLWSRRALFTHR